MKPASESSLAGAAKDVVAAASGTPVDRGRVHDRHAVGMVPVGRLLVSEERQAGSFVQYFTLLRAGNFCAGGAPPAGVFRRSVFATNAVVV